jgi:hypothetical protein
VGHARGTNAPSCTTVCPVDILPSSNFPRPHAHTEQLNPLQINTKKKTMARSGCSSFHGTSPSSHTSMKRKGSAKKKSQWKIELQKRTDTVIIHTDLFFAK